MRLLYSLAIRCYSGMISLASLLGNAKARLWSQGRRKQWDRLKSDDSDAEWIWFHVSSLGEFEQGLPLIEKIKERYPKYKLLLTFFSPSGYEPRKNFQLADKVAYMPSDTLTNAKRLVDNFNIKAAFFVKYDFWFNYMKVLNDNDIPLYYISALLHSNHYFFKFYASWFRKQLRYVKHYFVQNEETENLLKSIGIVNVTVTGDTRFDRVYDIARQSQSFPEIENFINGRKCIIAGSSWQTDERFLIPFIERMPENYCMIIAPHDISDSHINQITSQLKDYRLYTEIQQPTANSQSPKVLVVNTIGILKKIYRYARFAYVGGGFMSSIHNTQEALVYGCPVVIGPKYHKFVEAVDLVKDGGMFSVSNQQELNDIFERLINDEVFYDKVSNICQDYVKLSIGATEKILNYLQADLFATTP
ncbi:MAG: 3-deoxy-D-manno-octulosonic acid transferase [Bacteroidales bacterium]|nr:3-deoxy-D-manno-octulosonic acid transferase [Lentimicrobiaceae bacterium]MBQ2852446.1 3-deoxy-D-manno-octulosonic acid transferase [Bacteroidales bacterium]